jgi:hypothetical protein
MMNVKTFRLSLLASVALALGALPAHADSPAPGEDGARSAQARPAAASSRPTEASAGMAKESGQADAQADTKQSAGISPAGMSDGGVAAEANDDGGVNVQSNVGPSRSETDVDSSDATAGTKAGSAKNQAGDATAKTKSFTKSVVTPHMAKSFTHSISRAKDEDGDFAMAKAFAKAKAIDTPGLTRTVTSTKTSVKVDGDAAAGATAGAAADVTEAGPTARTFGETSAAVQ